MTETPEWFLRLFPSCSSNCLCIVIHVERKRRLIIREPLCFGKETVKTIHRWGCPIP
jgi:hypothetical protein